MVLAGCAASLGEQRPDDPQLATPTSSPWQQWPQTRAEEWAAWPGPEAATWGAWLAQRAAQLKGIDSLKSISRRVPDDCTGFVRLTYWNAGTELLGVEAEPNDNGVTAIYRHALALGALHWHTPGAGDLVFFVETYDRNHDGKRNDGLTHVGIVESVEPDGTVVFMHRVNSGVRESRLNLRHPLETAGPHHEAWNEVLRGATKKMRSYLTGELFAAFASAEELVRGRPLANPALASRP